MLTLIKTVIHPFSLHTNGTAWSWKADMQLEFFGWRGNIYHTGHLLRENIGFLIDTLSQRMQSLISFPENLEKYKYERYWYLKNQKSQVNLSLYSDSYTNRAFISLIIQYIYLTKPQNLQHPKDYYFFYSSSPDFLVSGEMSFQNSSRKNLVL